MLHPTEIQPGRLAEGNPLYRYLLSVPPVAASGSDNPELRISELDGERQIYLCEECTAGTVVVCKFFAGRLNVPPCESRSRLKHEFRCLLETREHGFDHPPFSVVRPWSQVEELGCLLTEDFVAGQDLDYFIGRAIDRRESAPLEEKLGLLAEFLARLHLSTLRAVRPKPPQAAWLFHGLVRTLEEASVIRSDLAEALQQAGRSWENDERSWAPFHCEVHGDVTPTNFIFDGEGMTAIDLERMHATDPAYDVGLLMADLKHHFALRMMCAAAAEPFIHGFLDRYRRCFGIGDRAYRELCFRSRFYMAMGELRIARHPWLHPGHRRWLAEEARRCLE